jgi:hypothetical protein
MDHFDEFCICLPILTWKLSSLSIVIKTTDHLDTASLVSLGHGVLHAEQHYLVCHRYENDGQAYQSLQDALVRPDSP